MEAGSFTLDIDVWVSASKDSSSPSFKPTAPFLCIIPDSPRYRSCGKPVPYNRRFVSVSGTLSNVVYKDPTAQDLEIKRFVITVEDIVFLGQPSDSPSTPAKPIPNALDGKPCKAFQAHNWSCLLLTTITGSNSQARRGFGFFKGTGASAKRRAPEDSGTSTSASASAPSTPTPAPAAKRLRTDNLPTGPSTRSASALNKQSSSVTVATPSSSAHGSTHDDIYA